MGFLIGVALCLSPYVSHCRSKGPTRDELQMRLGDLKAKRAMLTATRDGDASPGVCVYVCCVVMWCGNPPGGLETKIAPHLLCYFVPHSKAQCS